VSHATRFAAGCLPVESKPVRQQAIPQAQRHIDEISFLLS
jgi:hypothetical protein